MSNVYRVNTPHGARLIRAKNKATARNFVAAQLIETRIATPEDVHELAGQNVEIENAETPKIGQIGAAK